MSRKKKDKLYGPVLVIAIMIVIVGLLSCIFNLLGFGSSMTIISNGKWKQHCLQLKIYLVLKE